MSTWAATALPGLVALGIILLIRLGGALQGLECVTLDSFLHLRPPEAIDNRVVIIGIDETDIRQLGTYPVPDRDLAKLLRTLQQYQPSVIGLDIVRDIPVEPGHQDLVAAFRDVPNLIAVEKSFTRSD